MHASDTRAGRARTQETRLLSFLSLRLRYLSANNLVKPLPAGWVRETITLQRAGMLDVSRAEKTCCEDGGNAQPTSVIERRHFGAK